MRQTFNYHTHTARCGHAAGSDEAYVLEAIQNGYTQIGFSDHVPYINGHDPEERMKVEELSDYISSIKALQEKYRDQIEIRIGLEIEYIPGREAELQAHRELFDYIILGEHTYTLESENYFYYHYSDEDVLLYAQMVEKACDAKLADIVAHPDLFMYAKPEFTPACEQATRIICEAAKRNGILLEINLNGLKYGKRRLGNEERYLYPHRRFWEIASEYDVEVVYGLDAHAPAKFSDWRCYEIVNDEIIHGIPLKFRKELKFPEKLK